MKVITWKEMFDLKGDVVWAYYNKEESPSEVFIQYHSDDCKRVCEENFPILIPECENAADYFDNLQKFDNDLVGKVKSLDTFGDIYSREEEDTLVIIYDESDINTWINKLQSLDLNY